MPVDNPLIVLLLIGACFLLVALLPAIIALIFYSLPIVMGVLIALWIFQALN